jgi:hypothetical protein
MGVYGWMETTHDPKVPKPESTQRGIRIRLTLSFQPRKAQYNNVTSSCSCAMSKRWWYCWLGWRQPIAGPLLLGNLYLFASLGIG